MSNKKITFVINPISGSKNKDEIPVLAKEILSNFELSFVYTERKNHAFELAKKASENSDIIVAVGGDGTINEVASALVDKPNLLGIIPLGSGNGLARCLKIPLNPKKAISVISNIDSTKIDVGIVNDNYFFSNTGIGIDSTVIENYEKTEQRGFMGYFKSVIKSLSTQNKMVEVVFDNSKKLKIKPFMINIANSNQFGYDVKIAPKASLQDGELDMCIVKNINLFQKLLFGIGIMLSSADKLKFVKYKKIKSLRINNAPKYYQIDGELVENDEKYLKINIKSKSLNILV